MYVYIYIETNWPRSLPLPLPPFYTPLFLLFRSFGFAYTCHEQSARVSEDRGKKGGRLLFPANFQFSRLDSIRRVRSVTGLSEQIHDDVVIERELISSSNRGRVEKKRERGGEGISVNIVSRNEIVRFANFTFITLVMQYVYMCASTTLLPSLSQLEAAQSSRRSRGLQIETKGGRASFQLPRVFRDVEAATTR